MLKIQERDTELLTAVNGFGAITLQQFRRLMGPRVGYRSAAKRAQMLREAGFLRRIDVPIFRFDVLASTKKACVLTNDSLPPKTGVNIGTLRHDLRVVDLARALVKSTGGTFEPVRRIAQRKAQLGLNHLPDGILHRPNGSPVFIEVELSMKAEHRLQKIIAGYAANFSAEEVWYLIEDDEIVRAVHKHAREYPHIKVVRITKPTVTSNVNEELV